MIAGSSAAGGADGGKDEEHGAEAIAKSEADAVHDAVGDQLGQGEWPAPCATIGAAAALSVERSRNVSSVRVTATHPNMA